MSTTGTKRLHVKLGIFGAVPILMLHDKRITPNALKVYIALRSFEGVSDYCEVSQDKIAGRSGVPEDGIGAATKLLTDTGWVVVERQMNAPNRYRTCAYLKPAPEFVKPDGRSGNIGRVENFPKPEAETENFPAPDSGKLPDTEPGKLPELKDLSSDLEESSSRRRAVSPSAHRSRAKKHSQEDIAYHDEIGDYMVAQGDHWADGATQSECLYKLIRWFKQSDRDHWQDFGRSVVGMFWKLKCGTAPGQKYKDRDFWAKQPFTPRALVSLATRVTQYMRTATEDVMEGLT